ncbi:MAG: hypothetical protein D3906_17875 [Candidatus Electrothrix sp. AUS1_2]|nr:hypothetical protein [Candidatus Electrothrix sp. AUS1_2]
MYAIINAPSLAESKGLLKLRDLREIFRCTKDCCYQYGHDDYRYLVGLMKKFELCYELDDERVLIPQLFAVQEPAFDFDDSKALRFVLHYEDFLPASVMPRFIVKRHQEIQDELRWRNGVVLKNALLDARAAVRADNEARRIHIAVTGKERKVYLALIWLSLREINTGFEGLRVSERVPMPDDPKRSVPYKTLLTYREKGLEQYIPEDSEQVYRVEDLLAAVHPDNEVEQKKMELAVQADKDEGRLRRFGRGLNRYFDVELKAFGVTFDYKTFFDDILSRGEK